MTVFVMGAGFTGARIIARLGGDAVALGRSVQEPAHRIDLDRDTRLAVRLPPDYRLIYTVPPRADVDPDPRLEHLLSQLAPPPARFVYLSTTGVYGDSRGRRIDESTPPNPETARARRRVAAERRLEDWCAQHDVALVVLRVPGIYGPGRLGVERIRERVPVLDEEEANPGNRIHIDDLVTCAVCALSDDVPPGIYNVGDGDERSSTWFSFEVARQLGLPPPPTVSRRVAERQFTESRLSFLRESRRVDTRKMREVLGVSPRYANAEDGIRASLKS